MLKMAIQFLMMRRKFWMSGQANTMYHSIIQLKEEVDTIFLVEIIWIIRTFTIYMYLMNTDEHIE